MEMEDKQVYCPKCGIPVDDADADFCPTCGWTLTANVDRGSTATASMNRDGNVSGSPSNERYRSEETKDFSASASTVINPESYQKAQEVGQYTYQRARTATANALSALRVLATDPLGGMDEAINFLGLPRAQEAGIVFLIAYIVASFILVEYLIGQASTLAGIRSSLEIGDHLKIAFVAIVPALSLLLGLFLVPKIFGGHANFATCIFATGVALIPSTITLLLARFLGFGNLEVIVLAAFFGACITLLQMNAAVVDLHKLPPIRAIFATPLVFLIAAYLVKILLAQMTFGSINLQDLAKMGNSPF
jgi:hypothetical protein